ADPLIHQSDLSANRMDARPPADLLQQCFTPGPRGQEELPGSDRARVGLDSHDPLALNLEPGHRTTRLQANSQQLTAGQQRSEVSWISYLRHVRQVIGSTQLGPQGRFQLAEPLAVEWL